MDVCSWVPSLVGKIPWRRECQPTPIFLPGQIHGQRSLAGYSLWGLKESDTTEWLTLFLSLSGSQTIEKYCDVILLASINRTRFRWCSTSFPWRRKWQPIPILLPGESQGWQSLVDCRLRGLTESDMTEVT